MSGALGILKEIGSRFDEQASELKQHKTAAKQERWNESNLNLALIHFLVARAFPLDSTATDVYLNALSLNNLDPDLHGKTVLIIGSGCGLLALFAMKLKASLVVVVEPDAVLGALTETVIQENRGAFKGNFVFAKETPLRFVGQVTVVSGALKDQTVLAKARQAMNATLADIIISCCMDSLLLTNMDALFDVYVAIDHFAVEKVFGVVF